ncbi:hypothetical protein [Streptomyces sp. ID05-47C]|uniref:hypothetical protein n=1 Tax=Streptomyces sp. ID05-47C TaxID=3028665 RepID=UPI0029C0DC05|nr:hypothetical protein [Streptomyces sp. ID05-47C]
MRGSDWKEPRDARDRSPEYARQLDDMRGRPEALLSAVLAANSRMRAHAFLVAGEAG